MNATPATFPKTLLEAVRYFSDPDTCFAFMCELRWPKGVSCPECQSARLSFLSTRKTWKCLDCKKQFSVKKGTIMEDSPIGLDKWLAALWLVGASKNGISSYEIHRGLGVCQKTAWFLLHRIRLAMKQGTFEKMSGNVEADETYVGGKAKNMHPDKRREKITGRGRSLNNKAVVIGLLERHEEKGKSTVRAKVAKNTDKATLTGNIEANVAEKSNLYTDTFASYTGLNEQYVHEMIDHHECYAIGAVHTNGMENFWALLKRSLHGTYVSVDAYHLNAYIDEQAFKFNERKDNDSGRFRKVASGIEGKRLTYAKLTRRDDPDYQPVRGRKRKTAAIQPSS